jgi:hypothetical protein
MLSTKQFFYQSLSFAQAFDRVFEFCSQNLLTSTSSHDATDRDGRLSNYNYVYSVRKIREKERSEQFFNLNSYRLLYSEFYRLFHQKTLIYSYFEQIMSEFTLQAQILTTNSLPAASKIPNSPLGASGNPPVTTAERNGGSNSNYSLYPDHFIVSRAFLLPILHFWTISEDSLTPLVLPKVPSEHNTPFISPIFSHIGLKHLSLHGKKETKEFETPFSQGCHSHRSPDLNRISLSYDRLSQIEREILKQKDQFTCFEDVLQIIYGSIQTTSYQLSSETGAIMQSTSSATAATTSTSEAGQQIQSLSKFSSSTASGKQSLCSFKDSAIYLNLQIAMTALEAEEVLLVELLCQELYRASPIKAVKFTGRRNGNANYTNEFVLYDCMETSELFNRLVKWFHQLDEYLNYTSVKPSPAYAHRSASSTFSASEASNTEDEDSESDSDSDSDDSAVANGGGLAPLMQSRDKRKLSAVAEEPENIDEIEGDMNKLSLETSNPAKPSKGKEETKHEEAPFFENQSTNFEGNSKAIRKAAKAARAAAYKNDSFLQLQHKLMKNYSRYQASHANTLHSAGSSSSNISGMASDPTASPSSKPSVINGKCVVSALYSSCAVYPYSPIVSPCL